MMKRRNPFGVFFFPIITIGIYGIVWLVQTKEEMNTKGAQIPTAWLLIVPIANIVWLWKYAKGVEKVTGMGAGGEFCLLFFLGSIGMAAIQSKFNKIAE
ncbi:DUF4234 domain-containing protein [candidate division WOR-3 bacterium]|nr:DUF4234 domain-containing protein [candidate division WOR-3 bacterium]